jgi:hypothetical protein
MITIPKTIETHLCSLSYRVRYSCSPMRSPPNSIATISRSTDRRMIATSTTAAAVRIRNGVYRLRFLGHQIEPYAAMAGV